MCVDPGTNAPVPHDNGEGDRADCALVERALTAARDELFPAGVG